MLNCAFDVISRGNVKTVLETWIDFYAVLHKIKIVFIAEISPLFGFTLTSSIKEKSYCWKTIIFVCFSDHYG